MSKRIVDRLELIEVKHKNGERFSESLRPCGGLLKSLQEQKPVWEPGQGVLPGLYLQLLSGSLEFRPIPEAQRHDDQHQECHERRDPTVRTLLGRHASEHLHLAEPDRHDQGKPLDNSIEDKTPDTVISCATREIPPGGCGFGSHEQCTAIQVGTQIVSLNTFLASHCADDPIGSDNSDSPFLSYVDGFVEVREMAGIQRNENDTPEASVRIRDTAR